MSQRDPYYGPPLWWLAAYVAVTAVVAWLYYSTAYGAPAPFMPTPHQPASWRGEWSVWFDGFNNQPEVVSLRPGGPWSLRGGVLVFTHRGRTYRLEEDAAGRWAGEVYSGGYYGGVSYRVVTDWKRRRH